MTEHQRAARPAPGFVHAAGGVLRGPDGEPLVLRGVGIGNWLLPEGYMWLLHDGPSSPRGIEALVRDMVGADDAAKFWTGFRDRFFTEADVERIAACGYDHVRLPINSRLVQSDDGALIPAGIAYVDRCIEWCRRHGLWVVLDLHGAPGGQTGTNIDDSPHGLPELFMVERYRTLTVALWTQLAERYRDEPVVAGYDLLNEPLPDEYQVTYAADLRRLYQDLTAAIRAVDRNHLIIYEGSHWATSWDVFDEVWDPNSMLQFHKYWSSPDRASIAQYIDTGRRLGLPIYMGEGGENSVEWIQACFGLYEREGISWNFWPWKKMVTASSPCSVDAPPGWEAVVDHAAGLTARPAPVDSARILARLLRNMELASCTWHPEVVNATLQRVPLRLAGYGFASAAGARVPAEAPPQPRPEAPVLVEHLDRVPGASPWAPSELERGRAGDVVVHLAGDESVTYDVVVPRAGRARPTIEVVLHTRGPAGGPLEVWWDDERVEGTWRRRSWRGRVAEVSGPRAALTVVSRGTSLRLRAVDVLLARPAGRARGTRVGARADARGGTDADARVAVHARAGAPADDPRAGAREQRGPQPGSP
ncbi:glycoside hydrolase family 5 protein [Cellulomonas hominis]